ncbi:hypothetical protein GCM10009122_58690 [Fulvivirga kasyanovii]|uniref:Addiction module protein n=1 Tax=Fulvivirga kasyanovii TaxID=396812 RepID=A0ABW9RUU5_9BACT|nr:hypothetical protein [Fulvivirga kasyanovii]MTI27962.1 hypothetical protein [Fulvivirga kasyanovii]
MVTDKHRDKLIEKIKSIDDRNIIDEIYRLLKVDFDDTIYETNDEQKARITTGIQQIENGESVRSEEVFRKMRKWQNK